MGRRLEESARRRSGASTAVASFAIPFRSSWCPHRLALQSSWLYSILPSSSQHSNDARQTKRQDPVSRSALKSLDVFLNES